MFTKNGFVYFWDGPFSQWHPSLFVVDGVHYNCAEQYMMAEKARLFGNTRYEAMIMATSNPSIQKSLGRKVYPFNPAVWDQKAQTIVLNGTRAKFDQNPDLAKILLDTGDKIIVEASPYDKIWGIGLGAHNPRAWNKETWDGKNWLGYILTQVREEMKTS